MFGSAVNGLMSRNCDLDLAILFNEQKKRNSIDVLNEVLEVFNNSTQKRIAKCQGIINSYRGPLIRLNDTHKKLYINISINQEYEILNS